MRKSLDMFSASLRTSRLHFRNLEQRPQKSIKHRYERRKVRECLRLGDWCVEE